MGLHRHHGRSFQKLFVIFKSKITCIIEEAMALDLGTFYGLLFEPYIHFSVSESGYSVKCRRLLSLDNTRTKATEMRTLLGVKRDRLESFLLHTAKMDILGFSQINEIWGGCFNVPLKQNKLFFHRFGCPDRGEIYLSHCQRENTRHRRRSFRG